ncbi:hypothetical protein L211DRAFT_838311 [Terfezia boudieri ATCC MYA-4762]|uniref:Uncharacterized protein n=1 Tax=Terfezia boudieri ATCC MYA-4762 TaxID=1051890 RepID=A0A3N4LM28_9PEZI|nr:hypothetical protein L211DRAFT_838311 [Terfezia boudieri ATCC MYA-4762]
MVVLDNSRKLMEVKKLEEKFEERLEEKFEERLEKKFEERLEKKFEERLEEKKKEEKKVVQSMVVVLVADFLIRYLPY